MSATPDRYDAYPYPARDPADETKRLLSGSPSNLVEIDHYLHGGKRDWTEPLRVLVAGGGTGDGFIMLAQELATAGVPHEVVYLDRSTKSREVAAARAEARGLTSARYVTGDLLDASLDGAFDYIDCCGVLHHLADPAAGARRLAVLLAPGGGIGGMVYAPLGRTGVYPLQSAFRTLFGDRPYAEQVAEAKAVVTQLPKTNWFLRNPFLTDHKVSDAGFFDLLLHTTDRPFWADELIAMLSGAGLRADAMVEPMKYNPVRHLPEGSNAARRASALDLAQRCRLAEELTGSIKTHVFYASRAADPPALEASLDDLDSVWRLRGPTVEEMSSNILRGNPVRATFGGIAYEQRMNRRTAALLRQLDGARPLGEVLKTVGMSELEPAVRADLGFLREANVLLASRVALSAGN